MPDAKFHHFAVVLRRRVWLTLHKSLVSYWESPGGIVDADLERRDIASLPVESARAEGEALLRVWHDGLPIAHTWFSDPGYRRLIQRLGVVVTERTIARALLVDGDRPDAFPAFVEGALSSESTSTNVQLPSLTIAVCTRDRPTALDRCLQSLVKVSYDSAPEILVVDNVPSTREVADLCARFPERVRCVREDRPGLDWSRNRAIQEALGSVIAFTDDDCVADAGWAIHLAAPFVIDPSVEAVTGLVTPLELVTEAQRVFEHLGGFGRGYTRRWFRHTPARGARIAARFGRSSQFGTGASMAFRTATLRRMGGFDPALDAGTITLGGGDLDMFFRVLKAGGTLVYEPRAVIHHRHRRTMEQLEEQMRSWGTGMTSHISRNVRAWNDELPGFALLYAWLAQHWLSGVALAAMGLLPVPTRLLAAEAWSGLTAFGCYDRSRIIAASIAASSASVLPDDRTPNAPKRPRPTETIVRRVALDAPVRAIETSDRTLTVRLIGTWRGTAICAAKIDAQGQCIPPMQVADALAASVAKLPVVAELARSFVESHLPLATAAPNVSRQS